MPSRPTVPPVYRIALAVSAATLLFLAGFRVISPRPADTNSGATVESATAVAPAPARILRQSDTLLDRRPVDTEVAAASSAMPANDEEVEDTNGGMTVAADSDEPDGEVRKAALAYIKTAYPNSKVDGVFTLSFARGNLYVAGADTTLEGGARRTVDLLVRLYTRRNGAQYWRAESISGEEAARYLKKVPSDDVPAADDNDTQNAANSAGDAAPGSNL